MYTSCNGKYRIDAEGQQAEGGVVQAVSPDLVMHSSFQYWYIQFSCVQ